MPEAGEGSPNVATIEKLPHLTEAPQLSEAIPLLKGDNPNRYESDAAGFIAQFTADASESFNSFPFDDKFRYEKMRPVAMALGEYAVQTKKSQLAEYLFEKISPADKWLLYASAYDAATLDPSQLANWRLALESGQDTSDATNDASVNAARLLALTEIELHNYRSISDPQKQQEYKKRALAYKQTLNSVLTPTHKGGSDAYDRSSLSMGTIDDYNVRLSMAFARTGLWEEVSEIDPLMEEKHKISRLASKAVAGKLTRKDRFTMKRRGLWGEVLRWVDVKRKGLETEPPPTSKEYRHTLGGQAILEELAPEAIKQFDLKPSSRVRDLKIKLAAGDFEDAESTYNWIARTKQKDLETIQAALAMAKHTYDLEVATAAHEVYTNAFIDELKPAEAYVDEQLQKGETPDNDTLREWLKELRNKAYQLQSPQESMLAGARLSRLYARAIPDADEARYLMDHVKRQWTTFEQREGSMEQLAAIAESLQGVGIQFIKRWKSLDRGGFLGYEPTSLDKNVDSKYRDTWNKGYYEPEKEIIFWEKAAQELNAMLGEERYAIVKHEETQPPDEDAYPKENRRLITFLGSSPYGTYMEIAEATTRLNRGENLMARPDLTDRLNAIMSPIVEAQNNRKDPPPRPGKGGEIEMK